MILREEYFSIISVHEHSKAASGLQVEIQFQILVDETRTNRPIMRSTKSSISPGSYTSSCLTRRMSDVHIESAA